MMRNLHESHLSATYTQINLICGMLKGFYSSVTSKKKSPTINNQLRYDAGIILRRCLTIIVNLVIPPGCKEASNRRSSFIKEPFYSLNNRSLFRHTLEIRD